MVMQQQVSHDQKKGNSMSMFKYLAEEPGMYKLSIWLNRRKPKNQLYLHSTKADANGSFPVIKG